MIIGAHTILYSKDAEADRAFLRDVLGFPHVDVGHGWLIFGLPPAELAVHPGDTGTTQELYLMTDDIAGFVRAMKKAGRACSDVQSMGWGALVTLTLPSGAGLGVYQPRHARPPETATGKSAKKTANKRANQPAGKPAQKAARTQAPAARKARPTRKSRKA